MPDLTIKPGVLQVASAFPDPPFEVETDGTDSGFDAELMQSICRSLGLTWRLIKYSGDDYTVIEREGKREVRPDAFSAFTRVFDAPEARSRASSTRYGGSHSRLVEKKPLNKFLSACQAKSGPEKE